MVWHSKALLYQKNPNSLSFASASHLVAMDLADWACGHVGRAEDMSVSLGGDDSESGICGTQSSAFDQD